MRREFSAGGVLVRSVRGRRHLAAIRPQGKLGVDEVLILRESDVLAKVVGDRAAVA